MPVIESKHLFQMVEKSTESQVFSPLYFFFGDEPYLIHQAYNYLKVCSLHGGAADFNFTQFFAADVEISRVRDEVETLPMMAPRRVVVLREVQALSDKEWDQLAPLFQEPVVSTVFILMGDKIDKRKKVVKNLLDQALSVEFKKPFENQVPGWIRHIARAHQLEISDDAIQLMHKLVGNQLSEVEREIRKLQDFVGERNLIQLEDVAQVVSRTREENVFELTESLANGDRVKSLEQLVYLLDQGQSELGIVSLVARHMRILLLVKQGTEQNMAGQKLATYAQVPSYYLQDYVRQARLWTPKKLESVLVLLAETDRALKSSPLASHIWLENLILKACSFHQAGSTANP